MCMQENRKHVLAAGVTVCVGGEQRACVCGRQRAAKRKTAAGRDDDEEKEEEEKGGTHEIHPHMHAATR